MQVSMNRVDLTISFPDINVRTSELCGKQACGITVARIVDGRPQRSDQLIFAYQRGNTWKASIFPAECGRFRLELIDPFLKCVQEVAIDDAVLREGILPIVFDRAHCRRKLIPLRLKLLWWRIEEYLRSREQHPRRDRKIVARYRRRFRKGPIGFWEAWHELMTEYGCSIEFRADSTGTVWSWGTDEQESETQQQFTWRSLRDRCIEVRLLDAEGHPGEMRTIHYDFRVTRSAYGTRKVRMYDTGWRLGGEPGFWVSAHGIRLAEK